MSFKFVFNPLTAKFDIVDGNVVIPELFSDPTSPEHGETWVLVTGTLLGGEAMGVLGLTYSGDLSTPAYRLSYYTNEGTIVRTPLT